MHDVADLVQHGRVVCQIVTGVALMSVSVLLVLSCRSIFPDRLGNGSRDDNEKGFITAHWLDSLTT